MPQNCDLNTTSQKYGVVHKYVVFSNFRLLSKIINVLVNITNSNQIYKRYK